MTSPLDDGVVLVTGASSGIGRQIVRQIAGRARTIVIVARRVERLKTLASEVGREGLEVIVRGCDLGDLEATAAMVKDVQAAHGPVDVLINNAGLGDLALVENADWDKLHLMMTVNMSALALLCHALVPAMIERRTGGILNINSGYGLTFTPGFATYCGTKHFVTGFTDGLRVELRGHGVRVCQICPGPVDTEFLEIAGNPTGHRVPRWFQLSAAACAKAAIKTFDRDRALVIPGLWLKIGLALAALTPRWVLQLVNRPVATYLRRLSASADPD